MVLGNYSKLLGTKIADTENWVWALFLEYSYALKLENRARRWRIVSRFQNFFMVTHLFLFIHDIRYAYIHKKNVRCFTKAYVASTKKIISHRSYVATKIMWVTKKHVVATKQIMWHPEERFMLTKYV